MIDVGVLRFFVVVDAVHGVHGSAAVGEDDERAGRVGDGEVLFAVVQAVRRDGGDPSVLRLVVRVATKVEGGVVAFDVPGALRVRHADRRA